MGVSSTQLTDIVSKGGSKRNLSDKITMVDNKVTPFFSMVKKDGPIVPSPNMEWPVDAYRQPRLNATIDNVDVLPTVDETENYGVLQGRQQWFASMGGISFLADLASNLAGISGNKAAWSIAKGLVELKRDIEVWLCGDFPAVIGTGTVANQTRGLGDWINSSAQTVYPVPSAFLTPAASISATATASMTEATVDNVLESMYQQTGERKTLSVPCGTAFKSRFKDFTKTQTASTNVMSTIKSYNSNMEEKKIVNTIDVYEGDFGILELLPTVWNAYLTTAGATQSAVSKARAYFLNMERWQIESMLAPRARQLEETVGRKPWVVEAVLGLKCLNPLGEGKFNATS